MQDNVRNRTFRELFSQPVRYRIPFFQRGYAWERKQWDQLFDDIADEILPELDSGSSIDEIEHFFGPIVVLQQMDASGPISDYLIIDGQQRITTAYLLLGIIKEHLERLQYKAGEATGYMLQLNQLLTNAIDSQDDYDRLKVFSTKGDRLPTYRTIFGSEHTPTSAHYHTDIQLYQPGNNRVDEFRKYCDKKLSQRFKDVPSLWQLATVILDALRIVWIPLDSRKDNPQAIFESLNDKGMPLSASELICSYLFKPLEAVPDFEQLHNMQWLQAIRQFDNRERFEEYLRNLFSIGERKMVGKGRKLYVHFKNRNRPLSVGLARHRLAEIHDSANLYRYIVDPDKKFHPVQSIRAILVSISHTRMESCTPFLLDVLRSHKAGALSDDQTCAILNETLVLLVRRKMTELPTTAYDVLFPRLFTAIATEPDQVRALHEQFQKSEVWVSDQEFRDAFVSKTLYRSRDLAFTRMVLMEVDKQMQVHGQYPDYSTTETIEHVIPQTLDEHWIEYLGSDSEDLKLNTMVNSIGNLCLLSRPANSAAGQNPFRSKAEQYSEVTALARELRQFESPWNLAAVQARSARLGEIAAKRWAWRS